MKKILTIILAICFIFLLCACSAVDDSYSSSTSYDEETITVYMYDFNGNVLQQWNNVDYVYGSEDGVYFYLNGNTDCIEIYGFPVVVVEE